MRRVLRIAAFVSLVFAFALLVGCSSGSGSGSSGGSGSATPGSSAGGATVDIKGFAFAPASVTVKAGEKVTFTNSDSVAHTVVGDGFDSGNIAPGASWSNTFDATGTFSYKCSIHPAMTGSITVQ